jgi:hypothetical protein
MCDIELCDIFYSYYKGLVAICEETLFPDFAFLDIQNCFYYDRGVDRRMAHPLIFLFLTILSGFLLALLPSLSIALYFVFLGIVWLFAQGGTRQMGKHFHVSRERKALPI